MLTSLCCGCSDFYPRSPCGERRVHYDNYNLHCVISIHALLAESDLRHCTTYLNCSRFLSTLSLRRATACLPACVVGAPISIHALLAESDNPGGRAPSPPRHFYPRSPCGERRAASVTPTASRNFYPRSPCGERHNINSSVNTADQISIHALLAESDREQFKYVVQCRNFYPRSPCGERQRCRENRQCVHDISIHALLAESDSARLRVTAF